MFSAHAAHGSHCTVEETSLRAASKRRFLSLIHEFVKKYWDLAKPSLYR